MFENKKLHKNLRKNALMVASRGKKRCNNVYLALTKDNLDSHGKRRTNTAKRAGRK